MAVRHGYTIVPVATVGTEDVVRPVMDLPIREVLTAGGNLGWQDGEGHLNRGC